MADTEATVRTRSGHTYTVDMRIRDHELVGDEPKDSGGDDLGPGPFEYLLASLGSCSAITLKYYARREKIPLTDARVSLVYTEKLVPGEDGGRARRFHHIRQEITLDGDLTDDQRADLLRVARKCPVHKLLESKPELEEVLVPGQSSPTDPTEVVA